jgi:hypothetical protein
MTDLSPAAQAVFRAAISSDSRGGIAAAALRAAAEQSNELEVPFSVIDEWEKVKGSCARFYAAAEWGRVQALQEILSIATELENTHG